MRESQRDEFASLIASALGFYRQDVTPFAIGVWWQACERFDIEQVRKALTAHALDPDRGQFAPKPADLIRKLEGTTTDRSLMAWSKVMDAARTVGAYRSVQFDDPAIHAAIVDLGGWSMVCRSELDEMPFLQKRFTEAHRAYAARAGTFDAPRYLAGDHELVNALNGRPVAAPVLIRSDAARAAVTSGNRVLELQ